MTTTDKELKPLSKRELEKLLIVGAKIKIGKRYAEHSGMKEGKTIKLVNGEFYYENGLYGTTQHSPAIWDKKQKEYDSIYHLFGNELDDFMDCEVLSNTQTNQPDKAI